MSDLEPLVSVITPSFNGGNYLEKTIQSVLNQTYRNIEHLIIDGGSSDNTSEILKKYKGKYNLKWISEKDNGYVDACNKGLKMARGEIVGICHSDDFYEEGAIKKVVEAFLEKPEADLVLGADREFDYQINSFSEPCLCNSREVEKITPKSIYEGSNKYLRQTALFYRKRIIEKTGLLNPDFEFVAVDDWYARMFENGAKISYLNEVLAVTGKHLEKGSIKHAASGIKETIDFRKSHGVDIPLSLRISYFRWKYPQLPNLIKKHCSILFLITNKIIKIYENK